MNTTLKRRKNKGRVQKDSVQESAKECLVKEKIVEIKPEHDLWDRYRFAYSYDASDAEFMQLTGWEQGLPVDELVEMKRLFLDQLEGVSKKKFYLGRWKAGLFDSVGEYVTINIYFTLNLLVRGPVVAAPFVRHFSWQQEDVSEDPIFHPADVTYDHMEEWVWGDKGTLWAWRDKKDGTHGYASYGQFRSSWWTGSCPPGIQSCEFTADGIYVIYPYIQTSVQHEGLELKTHPWRAPGNVGIQHEGIMILTSKGEMRCKNMPTVEELDGDTWWEVGYRFDSKKVVRPRMKAAAGHSQLLAKIALEHVAIPELTYAVTYREKGPVEDTRFVDGNLIIETGYRNGPVKKTVVGDTAHYSSGQYVIIRHKDSPPPSLYLFSVAQTPRFGVKAYWVESGIPVMFKDGTKKWDFIGGKVDTSDASTMAALRREIWEETGVHYQGTMQYQGLIEGPEWTTALYKIQKFVPKKNTFGLWEDGMSVVPWITQYFSHIAMYDGKPIKSEVNTRLQLSHHGALLNNDIARAELAEKKVRFKITRATQVDAVSSAHVKFIYNQFFAIRPSYRTDFVQQIRSQYRLNKLVPPDPYQIARLFIFLEGYLTDGTVKYHIQVEYGNDSHLLRDVSF